MSEKIVFYTYARKSSENEDRQMQSIEDQTENMEKLAKDNDLQVKKIFQESKSAKKPNDRPIFNEMIDSIEKGEANGILCWQLNRLSRNPVDSARLQWLLQEGIIKEIRTIDKKFLPEDNALIFSIESGVANQFIRELKQNSKRGTEKKLRDGWYPSICPLGYKNDIINHTIVIDPERFDSIRKMWDMLIEGSHNPTQILDIINHQWELRTRITKKGGGRPLARSSIYKIFNNPFYYGYFEFPKGSGNWFKGKHTPMITEEEFKRAQNILGNKKKCKKHTFAFTGIIKCGTCGCSITAEEKTKFIKRDKTDKTYTFYRCTKKNEQLKCTEQGVTLAELEKQISNILEIYTISEGFKDWALEIIKEENNNETLLKNKRYEILEKDYSSSVKELDNLTNLRIRELIEDGEFIKKREELQNKIKDTKLKLDDIDKRSTDWVENIDKAFNFAARATQAFQLGDLQTKREILMALGTSFTLTNKKLEIKPMEWLISISNQKDIINKQLSTLEPTKHLVNTNKNTSFNKEMLSWGA